MADTISTKVITGPHVRFSYLNVFEAKTMSDGGTPKYSVSLIIRKSDKNTLDAIRAAIKAAYEQNPDKIKGSMKAVPPLSSIKTPLRDGDTERPGDEAYKGCYFLNANTTIRPEIVDASCKPILDRSEVYSGCYGRASITFYAYNTNGSKGIAASLNNLQKLKDGEMLGGRASAASDFATAPVEDEDFLN